MNHWCRKPAEDMHHRELPFSVHVIPCNKACANGNMTAYR